MTREDKVNYTFIGVSVLAGLAFIVYLSYEYFMEHMRF